MIFEMIDKINWFHLTVFHDVVLEGVDVLVINKIDDYVAEKISGYDVGVVRLNWLIVLADVFLDLGCCGLIGNSGIQTGIYESCPNLIGCKTFLVINHKG